MSKDFFTKVSLWKETLRQASGREAKKKTH